MSRKNKKRLIRISASAVLLIISAIICKVIDIPWWGQVLIYLVPYLVAGYDVLWEAILNIKNGRVFDENFLMCIATVGAFFVSEYPEAVFVMVFYQTGELFQSIAVGKSRKNIASLMDIKPDEARVVRDGIETVISPEEVEIGETVVVRVGEKIPIDGIITEGESELDCMALTGESVPRYVERGMNAVGGCINLSGILHIKATAKYEDSTVARVLELVENASSAKAKTDRFITKFAAFYTPIVVISAFLVFLIPSLITKEYAHWLKSALVFLVISCPCALVISVPLSYFGGIGASSRRGILIKGACYLEALAEVKTVVFDKTGTLTEGAFEVCECVALGDEKKLFSIASSLEKGSNHPVAKAVYKYCQCSGKTVFDSVSERAGMGVVGIKNGEQYFAGNGRLTRRFFGDAPLVKGGGSVVYVGSENKLYGYFTVKDKLKENAQKTIGELKKFGVEKTYMLSGDKSDTACEIAAAVGIDKAVGELLPEDKVHELETILGNTRAGKTVYVGDGINDAPVLTRADIGISMGAMGSDAAIEAADVVLMDDDPMKICVAFRIAKKTKLIVIENIVFALVVKMAFMLLGAFGVAELWMAVFADVGVSVIAILNAMRTLKLK